MMHINNLNEVSILSDRALDLPCAEVHDWEE